MEVLSTYKTDYVLVDTPGQLELFAFRESSNITVKAFGQQDSLLVYLSDPSLCRSPNGFISAMTLGALVQFRLQLPMINILSKCDTLSEDDEQRMLDWYTYPDALYGDLLDSDSNPETVVGMELFKAMENGRLRGDTSGLRPGLHRSGGDLRRIPAGFLRRRGQREGVIPPPSPPTGKSFLNPSG